MRAPRPVAGLPVVDPAELAHAWLLVLLEDTALDEAAGVATAVAAAGPALATALLTTLADDDALARLDAIGPPAELAGDAAEALRRAAADLLRERLPAAADAPLLAAAQDRLAHAAHRLGRAPAAPQPEVHVHDRRDTPAALLARALTRHAAEDEAFALLAGEVDGLDRWLAADPDAVSRAAAAVAAGLRPGDRLAAEGDGRWWIVAPDTDHDAARALASELAEAAEAAGPAGVAFGVALCPRDGVDAEALLAHADEALLAAQAAGRNV